MSIRLPAILGICAVTLWGACVRGAVIDTSRSDFFERKIRPILMDNCYKCHSPSAPKLKGGLNVASREGLLKGGENGTAIVPGHPEKSKLIEAVTWSNKDMQMPPKTQLSEAAIADLTKWVQMGAPWGGGVLKGPVGASLANYDKLRQTHWAWQPVRPVKVPVVANTAWPLGDVDRFVLAKMQEKGLHPVGQADKYELLRRVTFDLTGLPATAQEIDAFVADQSPDAYTKVVDRLLASPAFGERWGRHWLDVARYAESTGSARNVQYEYAWRYRDYVIDSFNSDKPFNQFVSEQIAGDLLPFKSPKQHNEQLVATGFLALGVKDLNEKDKLKYQMDNVDEQIDVVGKSILGLTVSCARCHDHKFDPIPQADYYKLAGIFKSTEIMCGLNARKGGAKLQPQNDEMMLRLDPVNGTDKTGNAEQIQQLQQKLTRDKAQLASEGGKLGKKAAGAAKSVEAKKRALETAALRQNIENIETQIRVLQQGSALAVGVKDASPVNSPIFERGEVENPGPQVPRGMISLCKFVYTTPIPSNQSGRLELARWMASRENPLTTRVVANRIWHHLFGEGIVRTVDNFGTTGEAPTHPELLDYLANRFVTQDNWSFKKMIRELVLTRTYQMASTWDAVNGASDPGDRFLWRMAPRRLEAEEIRDAILLVSGSLDTNRPVGSPGGKAGAGKAEKRKVYASASDPTAITCRSVYLPVVRDLLPIEFDRFDFANPEMVTGDREVTTVAPQALYLMNDPFVLNRSEQVASKLLDNDWMDQPARVDLAYKLVYGRPATATEKQRAASYLGAYSGSTDSRKDHSEAWASFCQALMASAEFRYLN
ncbi:MAG TPA: DUF1549 domain-containing protein [Tepidisphaeraceae bacterium]|nr:DUF1549 domain-containing protein [Tepidisphaeraceae bacterium]